ncbi:MAG: ABC transporter permease [Vicinamibacteria bacterium]|nr:ABC transporter permease [Vicinamibacteria bacterium]
MNAVVYAISEAWRSMWRRRGASLMAVLTASASLFVLGLLLLAGTSASRLLERWSAAAEFSVFLADGATPTERAAIERTLGSSGLVAGQAFVPAEEALRRFSRQFPDLAAAVASLPANPLPASYDVQLRPELARDPSVGRLAAQLRQQAGVSDVRYDRRWIERLLRLVGAARTAGLALVAVLTLAACLTIAGVVRLALHARRAEIEIMQLVGAPLAYIRGPFVLEGTLLGLTGAVVAFGVLVGVYLLGRDPIVAWAAGLVAAGDVRFLPLGVALSLVGGGAAIGCVGGLLAARTAR